MIIRDFLSALLAASLVSSVLPAAQAALSDQRYVPVKFKSFGDPNTGIGYSVVSFNATQMAADSTHRSVIKISRIKFAGPRRVPVGEPESIQTLQFNPSLVDFDIHCMPSHCYLACVTSRTKRNVELYKWTRTQFDLQAKRDSFARPHAVKLFNIGPTNFYIAVAQDQLHLSPYRYSTLVADDDDDDEPSRFIGAAVLKFTRGHERTVKYHQFIRLPFNPLFVHYYKSISSNNASDPLAVVQPTESHYLIFSLEANWTEQSASQAYSFIWSPLNEYFWPYRMPRGAEIGHGVRPGGQIIKLPVAAPQTGLPGIALNSTQPQDYLAPVETCFYQLQRLLADRDLQARRLIDSSKSVWRAHEQQQALYGGRNQFSAATASLTNITAQVIVLGNVTVLGSLIESPQISLIGNDRLPFGHALSHVPLNLQQIAQLATAQSPSIVENKFKQALFKLNYIREKLSRAILANQPAQGLSSFSNQIRFFGGLQAREVVLNGVVNSNVRLNNIPFRQLENELVSLNGAQDIGARVVFAGPVVADVLEIHGRINDNYYLRDAIDITSRRVQILDVTGQNYLLPGMVTFEFASIGAPEVVLAHNASINAIRLSDFITRDNRTQLVHGRKSFKRLSMSKLDLAHSGVQLNGFNLSAIARQAIRLRPDPELAPPNAKMLQTLARANFEKPVRVNRLTLNNFINQHINLTSLIHDSVKTNQVGVQQIFGQKNFLRTLKINQLTTEGAINGIPIRQVFNLNPVPPIAEHYRYSNLSSYLPQYDVPIEGQFRFSSFPSRSQMLGSLSASTVNGIDLVQRAVQRSPNNTTSLPLRPQIIRGHKTFFRPLRVLNKARMFDPQELASLTANATQPRSLYPYPLVNNIDLRLVSQGLMRQMVQPPPISVDTLEIDGNLNVFSQMSGALVNRTIFGSSSSCPLDAIRSRAILAGIEDQRVETPIRVNTLRAKSIVLDSGVLNDFRFPDDFVLRSAPSSAAQAATVEHVYGAKSLDHLVVVPSIALRPHSLAPGSAPALDRGRQGIWFDRGASLNQVPYSELRAFIQEDKQRNSSGEKAFETMNVYGNLYSKRINGQYWPDDILLRSLNSVPGVSPSVPNHKRIYSNLVFADSSSLFVNGQLVLRGPVELSGRLNGVNLTEFARQSATYNDKDLYLAGRPIANKIFLGGISVKGGIISQGLIQGVNFDEMKSRVVTIYPHPDKRPVFSQSKVFMSDVDFQGPVNMIYLNNLPINHYLQRIKFQPDGQTIRVLNKKTITGALRINRNLFVRGLINGVDFAELQARAISLSPPSGELTFNRTLTVEGDVFMDNLWIDEKNGTIDGVRLGNLLPIGTMARDEILLTEPRVSRRSDPFGPVLTIDGVFSDCQIRCNLEPKATHVSQPIYPANTLPGTQLLMSAAPVYVPQPTRPLVLPAQPIFAGTSRPALYNQQRNFTLTRTTPPYSLASNYQPPMMEVSARPTAPPARHLARVNREHVDLLKLRQPMSIKYEREMVPRKHHLVPDRTSAVVEQLDILRKHIISINLIHLSAISNLVVGFIDAPTNDVSSFSLPEEDVSHFDHEVHPRANYLQLDQIDFKFRPTVYHLSVGVATNRWGDNVTSIMSSLNGHNLTELSMLPVTHPNSAMFFAIPNVQALFLLVSQDYSLPNGMCPANDIMLARQRHQQDMRLRQGTSPTELDMRLRQDLSPTELDRADGGVHVYLFHSLQNSSSLASAYFDLYQTLDLTGIDSFEKFSYEGSSYVLAVSRALGKIHLLLLRGYTGFQKVCDIDAPMIDHVSVMYSQDQKPVLIIYQTSGLHRVMEAVII